MHAKQNFSPLILILLSVLTSCGPSGLPQERHGSPNLKGQPSPKEVIRLLLTLRDVPLGVHNSCSTAGTGLSDVNIGDYMSGWLAEFNKGPGANWIETSSAPAMLPDKKAGWKCIVMFRHVNGDDRWGWGVSFFVKQSDRQAVQDSVQCLGGG